MFSTYEEWIESQRRLSRFDNIDLSTKEEVMFDMIVQHERRQNDQPNQRS